MLIRYQADELEIFNPFKTAKPCKLPFHMYTMYSVP